LYSCCFYHWLALGALQGQNYLKQIVCGRSSNGRDRDSLDSQELGSLQEPMLTDVTRESSEKEHDAGDSMIDQLEEMVSGDSEYLDGCFDERSNISRSTRGTSRGTSLDHSFSRLSSSGLALANDANAFAWLLLFGFTGVVESTLQFLDCAHIGGVDVLCLAGETRCGANWQWLLWLVLVALALLPAVVVTAWLLCQLPAKGCGSQLGVWVRLRAWPQGQLMAAMRQHATEPFVDSCWHWTPLLCVQRLLLVMCHALATEDVYTSVGAALVSLIFLLMQLLGRPYREQRTNELQTVAAICLLLLCTLEIASSAFRSAGFDVHKAAGLATLSHDSAWVMFLLLFPTPLLCLFGLARKCSWCAAGNQGLQEGDKGGEDVSGGDGDVAQKRRHEQEKVQLLQEKQQLAQEKQQLAQERQQETQRHEQEKAQLLQDKQQLAQEKQQLAQEKQQERQRHEQEKAQLLLQEKQQLAQERQEQEQEQEQLPQKKGKERAELLARLEEPQGQGEPRAGAAARRNKKDLYRTFDPVEEGETGNKKDLYRTFDPAEEGETGNKKDLYRTFDPAEKGETDA
jgi:hypothetical protein